MSAKQARAKKEEALNEDPIAQRVARVVKIEKEGMENQLRQYGFCEVNGFLGSEGRKLPDEIREQMVKLFQGGFFEQESESDSSFKIGGYRFTNQDREHRFRAKIFGSPEENQARTIERQFEVAPTVTKFVRSLVKSLSGAMREVTGGPISSEIAMAEMVAMCGEGAQFQRRVNNVEGWNTERGYVPDPRKLTVIYFANPNYRRELGGDLQLEGVVTPTGCVSIAPVHDRLVMFWADKTVWSMRPCQATMISEHQFFVQMHLLVQDPGKNIDYDPNRFTRWFPQLQDVPFQERVVVPGRG